MSGHSKWATTRRQKAAVDAKRSSIFTRLANVITIAARHGSDPEMNPSLRIAIDRAREASMPKDNIERAIKRGSGEFGAAVMEELTYEGFGPGKSGFIVTVITDNKNRAASDIRHLFTKYGGSLGASGSVNWNFDRRGVIRIEQEKLQSVSWSELELSIIDAGADDIKQETEGITIFTPPDQLMHVVAVLTKAHIATTSTAIEYVARAEKKVSAEDREKIEKLIEALEDNADVQDYYTDVAL